MCTCEKVREERRERKNRNESRRKGRESKRVVANDGEGWRKMAKEKGESVVDYRKLATFFALLVNVKFLKEAMEPPPDVTSPTFNFRNVASGEYYRVPTNESRCVFCR